ncbi:helix-turn-helix domain-containing protein [Pseudomonas alabamensis]|uniref:helix-turn-helix domain-containing protein n=1 Tax=Pseudomonas alabamensis TaxID=3064349 RepID=UPI003F653016
MRVGISGFVPERLTQARILSSMTKIELSQRIGKSSSTISRWESGDSCPESDAIESLSFVLGFQVAWFMKPFYEKPESTAFYRTLATTSGDLRNKAGTKMFWFQEIASYLSEFLDWPVLNIPLINAHDHRGLDGIDIATAALKCRELWGLGIGPIEDLSMAVEGAGVICAHVVQGNTKMDGLSQWDESQNRPFILLSVDKRNYFRSRFDLAHELGHIVLHRNIKTFDILHLKEIEKQANYFASCLLMPEESLSVELPKYPSLENLLMLKKRWGVSVAAIIYRAEKSHLITEDEALRLRKNYSARGWSKGEPFDQESLVEEVRLMPRAVRAVVEAGIKSKLDLIRDLLMPVEDIEQICGLVPGFLSGQSRPATDPTPVLKSVASVSQSARVIEFRRK